MLISISGESYQAYQKLNELRDNFFKKVDASKLNYSFWEGDGFSFGEFYKGVRSLPFLAEKRLLVIRDILKQPKDVQKQVEDVWEDLDKTNNIIIFFDLADSDAKPKARKGADPYLQKKLSSLKFFYFYQPLPWRDLANWISGECQKSGLQAEESAINALISYSDNDLWFLSLEIKKIIGLTLGSFKKVINKKDIEDFLVVNVETNIFSLMEAIGRKQKDIALNLLGGLLEEGTPELVIISLLSGQVKKMMIAKDCQNRQQNLNDLGKILRVPPYVASKILQQSGCFSMQDLMKFYNSLLSLDRRVKTSGEDIQLLMDLFILGM